MPAPPAAGGAAGAVPAPGAVVGTGEKFAAAVLAMLVAGWGVAGFEVGSMAGALLAGPLVAAPGASPWDKS